MAVGEGLKMDSSAETKERLAARSDALRADFARTFRQLEPSIEMVETGFAFARTAASAGTCLASLRSIWTKGRWTALPGLIWQNVASRWF